MSCDLRLLLISNAFVYFESVYERRVGLGHEYVDTCAMCRGRGVVSVNARAIGIADRRVIAIRALSQIDVCLPNVADEQRTKLTRPTHQHTDSTVPVSRSFTIT